RRACSGAAARERRRGAGRGPAATPRPLASAGPPLVSGGEVAEQPRVLLVVEQASTGPPLVSGGESRSAGWACRTWPSFNGAAARERRREYSLDPARDPIAMLQRGRRS